MTGVPVNDKLWRAWILYTLLWLTVFKESSL